MARFILTALTMGTVMSLLEFAALTLQTVSTVITGHKTSQSLTVGTLFASKYMHVVVIDIVSTLTDGLNSQRRELP